MRKLLHGQRYPEYAGGLAKYFESPHYQAEQMLAGLLPDSQGRLDVLFDFSSVGAYHNGTFEHANRSCGAPWTRGGRFFTST